MSKGCVPIQLSTMSYADIKRGEEQAEADRLLGALVRKMPKGSKLYRCVSQDSWNAYNGELCRDANGHSPEQVLAAALEGEGVESREP